MRKFTKLMLTLALLVLTVGGVNARTVYTLGSPMTFEAALASGDPFVLVQDGKVLCGTNSDVTFKSVSEIVDYAFSIHFEKDGDTDNYFMALYDQAATPNLKGYLNASGWSHVYLSNINKNGTKGEEQDGALWTITLSEGTQYAIRNVGVAEGNYNYSNPSNKSEVVDRTAQGYMKIITDANNYWVNHITHFNTIGPTWQFYSLSTEVVPDEDPVYFGWDGLTFDGDASVSKDDATKFIRDARGYAPYWTETAKWEFGSPRDVSAYRYLVLYAKRNVTKWGNEDAETGGTVFIRDNAGVSFRGDDYVKYGDPAVDYPEHTGKMWMNIWNEQRVAILDLQWLANTNKYGDGSGCKVLDITQIKAFGFSGDFTIGGAYLTNTLPNTSGDYSRKFTEEADPVYGNFGTICLNFSAVCCGAQLYQIVGKTASGITLEEYEGVMEAGKPYFYQTLEAKQQYWGSVRPETAVYFFKAGYATAGSPVANNGLIGTFTATTAPKGDNYYVLSGNKLWQVDSDVTVGANKAYVDLSAISSVSAPEFGLVTLDLFGNNGTTGISASLNNNEEINNNIVFNLNGQRVANPTKGLYIVNGKKVVIK